MATEILMPALSPTMEEGTLAKWLVKEGDTVKSGDILAEIETDKATMEFEAVDEGVIGRIMVSEGTQGVKVNTPIAVLVEEGESVDDAAGAAGAADSALGASALASGLAAGLLPMSSADSPSSKRTAMGVFTLTPWLPSPIRILPRMPSSTASNSIVALSVSISAMMSPALTASPSFFSHFASVPSSMVGDRAGIRISVAIVVPLPQAFSVAEPCGRSSA